MALGTLVGNVCYSDAAFAVDQYFSAIVPSLSPNSSVSYQKSLAGVWELVTDTAGSITRVPAVIPSLPSCDTLQGFNDGLTIGAAMVGALVLASLAGVVSRSI